MFLVKSHVFVGKKHMNKEMKFWLKSYIFIFIQISGIFWIFLTTSIFHSINNIAGKKKIYFVKKMHK